MEPLKWLPIVLVACIGLVSAQVENCDESKWLPEGSEYTSPPECVEYDGSLVPDCGEFIVDDRTSYFHLHEYNCSRFWECGPQGACLFSCAPCGMECGNYDGLVFDCRYQYPEGPVCDFPDNVNCTNGYSTNSKYPTNPTQPATPSTPKPTDPTHGPGYCESDGDCTGMTCSQCLNNQCFDPECCTDEDCEDGYICEDGKCVPMGGCDDLHPCDGVNGICDLPWPYENCEYCDPKEHECKPGCDSDANCPEESPFCQGHICGGPPSNTGLTNITISTKTCQQCPGTGNPLGVLEIGLQVMLKGEYGTSCESNGLDNLELVDYDAGFVSFFDGQPDDDGDDDGLGGCKNADLNYGLTGGTATWLGTGQSIWTAADSNAICIDFYDPNNSKPTCCCSLATPSLGYELEKTSELTGCECTI